MAAADAVATYQVDLKDGVAGPAVSAEKALENLRASLNKDQQALNQLNKAMKNLQSGTVVNVQQFKALDAQIKATKDRVAQAQGAIVDLGGALTGGKKPATGFAAALEQLKQQAQGMGGPIGQTVGRFDRLKALFGGGAMALGVLGLAAAFVALTAASITAAGALLAYGLAQSDARRSELLHLEAMTKLRSVWGIAAGVGTQIQGSIDRVTSSVALGRQEVSQYAQSLYKAGLRGANLDNALEGVAITAATVGQGAASRFAGLAQAVALTGGSVKKLSDTVKQRLGGIAAKQLLSLDVQGRKLRENFGRLFDSLPIDGALKGFKQLADLFSLSTVTGQGLKTVITVLFTPIAKAVEYLAPIVKGFFQGILIGILQMIVWVLEVAVFFRETFGSVLPRNIGLAEAALTTAKYGVIAIAGVTAVFGAAMLALLTVLTVKIALFAAPWIAVGVVIWGLVRTTFQVGAVLAGYLGQLGELLANKLFDWDLGRAIIDGIVYGLKAGAGFLWDALKFLASGALDAFKFTLGIHSPSREFAKLGVQLPAGVQQGIERGSPALDTAVDEMVRPVGGMGAPGTATGAKAGATSNSLTIEALHIHTSSTDGNGLALDFRAALEDVWSGMMAQKGSPS